MNKALKKITLHVRYGKGLPDQTVEVSEEEFTTLTDGGFATEAKEDEKVTGYVHEDKTETSDIDGNKEPTNAEIVAGLEDVEDKDKEWLVEQLGEFQLALKVDGTLNAKSLKKIEEIFAEGDE